MDGSGFFHLPEQPPEDGCDHDARRPAITILVAIAFVAFMTLFLSFKLHDLLQLGSCDTGGRSHCMLLDQG
jgi:hypothetical protein